MAYGLETGGWVLGGLLGGAGGALQGAGERIPEGMVYGGALGAATGTALTVETGPGVVAGAGVGALGGAALGGTIYGGVGAIQGAIAGAPAGAAKGEEIGRQLSDWIVQMTNAEKRAEGRRKAVTKDLDTACASCGCAALADGVPGSKYRGGAHAFMRQPGLQSHHMPPVLVSSLPEDLGPAIQMEPQDHYSTPSFGRNLRSPNMQSQRGRIQNGSFMVAFAIDAAAVEALFPGKYIAAIAQATAYAQCLKRSGLVK